jgi:hypothetical protein
MYIALSDDLIEEFLAYKGNSFNQDVIAKLFKYLHPFKIGKYQQHLFQPEILKQLVANPVFVHSSSASTEIDLIKDTRFKIMLTKDRNVYPYINILGDEIDINFNALYKANEDRSKAIAHIKDLLENATYIEIIDKYLFKPIPNSTQWAENLKILKEILPHKRINIKFISDNSAIKSAHKTQIKSCYTQWNLTYPRISGSIHDRYIKTDKVTILLSSGIDYLHDTSKDLTYLVRSNS